MTAWFVESDAGLIVDKHLVTFVGDTQDRAWLLLESVVRQVLGIRPF